MKNELRKKYRELRKNMAPDEVAEKSIMAEEFVINSSHFKEARVVMVYMPLGNEVDTTLIIKQAWRDGKLTAFPVTDGESGVITPVYADENTAFEKGAFSVSQPLGRVADPMDIDLVIVPGIAFDKKGGRIGFGKGCYDKFLENCRAVKMGLCYELQICPDAFCGEYDQKMDYIVTENGVFKN